MKYETCHLHKNCRFRKRVPNSVGLDLILYVNVCCKFHMTHLTLHTTLTKCLSQSTSVWSGYQATPSQVIPNSGDCFIPIVEFLVNVTNY